MHQITVKDNLVRNLKVEEFFHNGRIESGTHLTNKLRTSMRISKDKLTKNKEQKEPTNAVGA